jgi:hypothetical protein
VLRVNTQLRSYPRLNGTAVAPGPRDLQAASLNGRRRSISTVARLALRARVYVTRGRLDRQIVAARPCESPAALALRARQLSGTRARENLARDLCGIVDHAERIGSRRALSAVVIDPAAVAGARRAILGLAQQLGGPAPVSPRGVLLARALLTDPCSPLFNRACERTVAQAVGEVEDALRAKCPGSGSVQRLEPLR